MLFLLNLTTVHVFNIIKSFRVSYFKLIEECVTQIVRHKSGCNPDFSATKRIQIDVEQLLKALTGILLPKKNLKWSEF